MALHTMLTVSSNLNNYHSVDGRRTCTVMSASSLLCYTRCRQKGLVFVPSCALCELSDCCYGAYTVHMPCYSVDCCCSCENVKACTHCAACNTDMQHLPWSQSRCVTPGPPTADGVLYILTGATERYRLCITISSLKTVNL